MKVWRLLRCLGTRGRVKEPEAGQILGWRRAERGVLHELREGRR